MALLQKGVGHFTLNKHIALEINYAYCLYVDMPNLRDLAYLNYAKIITRANRFFNF